VYTLHDLRAFGRKQGWCPYFLARHMMSFANVVVYNYQYMIDPKVSQVRGVAAASGFAHC
jgi:DNA excision repair protein ERCC-2